MSKHQAIIPVILSGGSGTRLWPLSRKMYPKQFIPLRQQRSLFQDTIKRVMALADGIQAPIVVCNEEHRFMAAEQLRLEAVLDAEIILEPAGRNTAPAIALAAYCAQQRDPQAIMLVLPADHVMHDQAAFAQAIATAMRCAEQDFMVTFGVTPTRPETGYGYIQAGAAMFQEQAYRVAKFVEKPALEVAQEYLESGLYAWNSGMFMFKAASYIEQLQQHQPDIAQFTLAAYQAQHRDLDFIRIDPHPFKQCQSESIDYAVMEKTSQAMLVPLNCHWSDVGSWHALWESLELDDNNNASSGDVILQDCEGCMVHSSHRLVTAIGLRDIVIAETSDALLITPRSEAQKVKSLTQTLQATQREEANTHLKVYRPWGEYESVDHAERFQVKRITVKPGERLSLQKHHHRAEHWIVVNGTARVTCGDKEFLLAENESTYIPIGEVHRLENPGKIPLELIEVQSGSYLGEDDIERFEDKYGR
ncbi:MAG: mannose-1-phosphate guanylyltransferase/mannose-6-phosphate isomerase [Candidatus Thioglobus sp.]|nr:MAG: mannose-1-phosphate guanylyltransferase/mannose-6-phosphate isomerase [Candidatus Thioglobus sp.]